MNNILITGDINIGKSTLLKAVMERVHGRIGGFVQFHEDSLEGKRIKFLDLNDGRISKTIYGGSRGKKEGVNIDVLNREGRAAVCKGIENGDIVVMDELGFLEENALEFKKSVEMALDSKIPILAVVKNRKGDFLDSIRNRKDVEIFSVNRENRGNLCDEILKSLKKFGVITTGEDLFYFDREKVEAYNRALEDRRNDYPKGIFDFLKNDIGDLKDKRILDIGAGSGALTIPFLEEGARVSAVDSSLNMYKSLVRRSEKYRDKRKCVLAPWENVSFEPHDYAVCAFCSNNLILKENMKKFFNEFKYNGYIIIHRERERNNFGKNILRERMGMKKKEYNVIGSDMRKVLEEQGLNYEYKPMDLKIYQFFDSYDEACNFLRGRFSFHLDKEDIWNDFLRESISNNGEHYFIKNVKKVEIIKIIKEESIQIR